MGVVFPERRKYLRLEAPLKIRLISQNNRVTSSSVKNISPIGLRFESGEPVGEGSLLELTLAVPEANNPVHMQGKVVWYKRTSSKDNHTYDVGCEFLKIEEDNKNTFLKYLCDLIYTQSEIDEEEKGVIS